MKKVRNGFIKNLRHLCLIGVIALGLMTIVGTGGNGDDGDEGGIYACSYEKRGTDGCDGYGWGAWEAGCYQFNSEDYYISPEEVCANITDGGLFCQAGCCVDSEYRNVQLTSGSCP